MKRATREWLKACAATNGAHGSMVPVHGRDALDSDAALRREVRRLRKALRAAQTRIHTGRAGQLPDPYVIILSDVRLFIDAALAPVKR